MMKTKILAIVYSAILFLGMVSCQEPEEFHPNVERNGINNLTASFLMMIEMKTLSAVK